MTKRLMVSFAALLLGAFVIPGGVGLEAGQVRGDRKKCCVEPKLKEPGDGRCTKPCRKTVNCMIGLTKTGSWVSGHCKSCGHGSHGCKQFDTTEFKPIHSCFEQACLLPNGRLGEECVWSPTGWSTETQSLTTCTDYGGGACPTCQ